MPGSTAGKVRMAGLTLPVASRGPRPVFPPQSPGGDGNGVSAKRRLPYGVRVLRAVVFDLFNTLVDDFPDARVDTLRLMAADLDVDPDAFVERFHEVYQQRIIGVPGTLAEQCRDVASDIGHTPDPTRSTLPSSVG
jgi:hypothetical protein